MAPKQMAVSAVDRPVLKETGPTLRLDIAPARVGHVFELGPILRDMDKREIYAVSGRETSSGLLTSLQASERAFSCWLDGDLVAMAGIAQLTPTIATPWCVMADLSYIGSLARAKLLLNEGRRMLQYLGECTHVPMFWNMTHQRNTSAQRWLSRLGFAIRFDDPIVMRGEPTLHFYKRNPSCAE